MKNNKMRRLIVVVPAILIAVFLLNSFMLKEKEVKKKPIIKDRSAPVANIIFKSTDGGQTWQDVSLGLPERLQREGVWQDGLFADGRGLYLRVGNGVYHSEPNSIAPFWRKEMLAGEQRNIAPANNGILVYNIRGNFLKKINGRNDWLPIYTDFQDQAVRIDKTIDWMYKTYREREVRSVFETVGGTVFISSGNGLFRSTDEGKAWQQVYVGDGRMKLAESNGVLLSTSNDGILRSTDNGQTWVRVISEGGVGMAVENIDGGFAAIVHNIVTQTNTIHISLDSGKTWNAIGQGLQPSWNSLFMKKIGLIDSSPTVLSIKQMGKYLMCGRSDGIFRSSDMGKTWHKLALPSLENFGFNLVVSGNAMYVIPDKGC